ncbi:MAG: FG-GAP repeat domain-containing protein [bacterium]
MPKVSGSTLAFVTLLLIATEGCSSGTSEKPSVNKQSIQSNNRSTVKDEPASTADIKNNPGPGPIFFTDVTDNSGVNFIHFSGNTPEKPVPTANGSGLAIFDFDSDGLMDIFFAQSTHLPVDSKAGRTGKLFRNLGEMKFKDVTETSGLGANTFFTHAAIAADVDNDGDPDLYLCNFGKNALFRNDGKGKFTDISGESSSDIEAWSSSAAFLDYDGDGFLDIYISTYADWKFPEDNKFCGDAQKKVRLYCDPKELRPDRDYLLKNMGNCKFRDMTEVAGILRRDGHGFGVITADFNSDHLTDIYVANDQDSNFLFMNRGNGKFEDVTAFAGASLDSRGHAQAGMGVDAEDFDGDGLPEIIVTNFANEPNTLYKNLGKGLFMDVTSASGLLAPSLPYVGWGASMADFDLDGWPDLFVANGHLDDNRGELGEDAPQPQPALLFHNLGGRRFEDVGKSAGSYFQQNHVGRGVGWGDLDNDGDIDVVVSHKDGKPSILRNDSQRKGRHWVRLELVGSISNRDAIGARVELNLGERKLTRLRKGGCGLMSTHDARLTIGVDAAPEIKSIRVIWPTGKESLIENVKSDTVIKFVEPRE